MKLERLTSTTPSLRPEAAERARAAAASNWQVGAMEGVEADRRRSLRQELDEFEAEAIAEFEGEERIRQSVRALAAQIARLGPGAAALVRPDAPLPNWRPIDDKA